LATRLTSMADGSRAGATAPMRCTRSSRSSHCTADKQTPSTDYAPHLAATLVTISPYCTASASLRLLKLSTWGSYIVLLGGGILRMGLHANSGSLLVLKMRLLYSVPCLQFSRVSLTQLQCITAATKP
jgi:hypothetical protein